MPRIISLLLIAFIMACLATTASAVECKSEKSSEGELRCGSCTEIGTNTDGKTTCTKCSNGVDPKGMEVKLEAKDDKPYLNYGTPCSSQVVSLALGLVGLVATTLN